jgi:hypothetical protein
MNGARPGTDQRNNTPETFPTSGTDGMTTPDAEQLQLDDYEADRAAVARTEGQRAALAVGDPDWAQRALAVIDRFARAGDEFTAEDIRRAAGQPPSPAAMGAVFGQAARAGRIRCTGWRASSRATRRGSSLKTWRGRL